MVVLCASEGLKIEVNTMRVSIKLTLAWRLERAECKQCSVWGRVNSQSTEASSCVVYTSPWQLVSKEVPLIYAEQVKEGENFFVNNLRCFLPHDFY